MDRRLTRDVFGVFDTANRPISCASSALDHIHHAMMHVLDDFGGDAWPSSCPVFETNFAADFTQLYHDQTSATDREQVPTLNAASHYVRQSIDSSGREQFLEQRTLGENCHTVRWDSNERDENGNVRRRVETGVCRQGGNKQSGDNKIDENTFEQQWAAAGLHPLQDSTHLGNQLQASAPQPTTIATPFSEARDQEGHVEDASDHDVEDFECKNDREEIDPQPIAGLS